MLENHENKSVNELWTLFKNHLLEVRDRFVPMRTNGKPSWMIKGTIPIHQELYEAIKTKNRLHRN